MNRQEKETLDELLRYHASVIGGARMTALGLRSLRRAFETVDADPQEMIRLVGEVLGAVRDTRPKLIALIDLLSAFEEELHLHVGESDDCEVVRARAIELLEQKGVLYRDKCAAVTRQGLDHVASWNTVLVHSPSSVVTNILLDARRHGIDFRVLVLQLDPVRTPQVTEKLEGEAIPHLVVPMPDLCHYQAEVDKLFIGALTVTPDLMGVAPAGTAAVLSLCHLAGIRTYCFANTLHYSTGPACTQQIHTTRQDVVESSTRYRLTSHSHDLIDLMLVDVMVNEYGVTSLEQIRSGEFSDGGPTP